eukprot:135063-Pleurochrysis_carterae.AAC.1
MAAVKSGPLTIWRTPALFKLRAAFSRMPSHDLAMSLFPLKKRHRHHVGKFRRYRMALACPARLDVMETSRRTTCLHYHK